MATQSRLEKIVTIECMSVAGGNLSKLPDSHKYFVNIQLDYTNVDFETAIELASGGSSVRVKAQALLREREADLIKEGTVAESAKDVKAADLGTIVFDVAVDFESEGREYNAEARGKSAFKKMDDSQRMAFIMETLGVDEDTAQGLLNKD